MASRPLSASATADSSQRSPRLRSRHKAGKSSSFSRAIECVTRGPADAAPHGSHAGLSMAFINTITLPQVLHACESRRTRSIVPLFHDRQISLRRHLQVRRQNWPLHWLPAYARRMQNLEEDERQTPAQDPRRPATACLEAEMLKVTLTRSADARPYQAVSRVQSSDSRNAKPTSAAENVQRWTV
ncbi:hypothetical protein R70241_05117 [Paraburkholderia saeva]|nr:hypothetical protein R70241_05117 [Paraburkholderia saeva]